MARALARRVVSTVIALGAAGAMPASHAAGPADLSTAPLVVPRGAPDGLVFLITGAAGRTDEVDRAARRLSESEVAVAIVDYRSYLERAQAAAGDADCLHLVPDIERASKQIQDRFGRRRYLSPILAGTAEGAALAWAMLAQAPDATIAGAAMDGFDITVPTHRPLCPAATAATVAGGFSYPPQNGVSGFLQIGPRPGQEPAARAFAAAIGPAPAAVVVPGDGADLGQRLAGLLEAPIRAQQNPQTTLADLPLIELPAGGGGDLLLVMWSGDGGWRDLDKVIAAWLQQHGVAVVGVDSLRYFWAERSPEQAARDQARIIEHYARAWNRDRVVLAGYSFGADILPFVVNRLPPAVAARVARISLLGLSTWADFQFRVGSWLSDGPGPNSLPTRPELARLDPAKLQCFYGEDEDDTACTAPEIAKAQIVRTAGGHHFDGDYAALARMILAGVERPLP